MYLPRGISTNRLREAEAARRNRAEIVAALSQGQVSRRELLKAGIFTAAGTLALKHGLSPFAPSAYGAGLTGVPRSPLFTARKFTVPLPRLDLQHSTPLSRNPRTGNAHFPSTSPELPGKRLSYHTDFSNSGGARFVNPLTGRGPIEGRPPGETFAHQRWDEFFPKVAYVMSVAPVARGARFHPDFPEQDPNKVWTFGAGNVPAGTAPPPLIKARYGEPLLARIYNNLPVRREDNGGFGRNELALHLHNAHNGAESDGASNAFHFPGTFFDYRWSTTLARRDHINPGASDARASAPDGQRGLNNIPGDFRELQGSMWFHDHRFFFTAENVYKGVAGVINYYSGPDRGNERVDDAVNLRLPSGQLLDSGNVDFDVNLAVADRAFDRNGQLFFDIFDTDGFIGDVVTVNSAYAPFFEVLPRKYRFRLVNASMARFYKFVLVDPGRNPVQLQIIANDGNLLVNPVTVRELDYIGSGERFDFVVDFSTYRVGDRLQLVNVLEQVDGRLAKGPVSLAKALAGISSDPAVGSTLEFRVVGKVASVDIPGLALSAADRDWSLVPVQLTEQIPIVTPVRERIIEWARGGGGGPCIPDCGTAESFPWVIKINGEAAHTLNANRISALIPRPNEVEHWTFVNGGGGWDHPVHLHFEEAVTIDRGGADMFPGERLARKDVWRLRPGGKVKVQVNFSDFGGAYVAHCHNTAHEDFAMLMRFDVLTDKPGEPQAKITATPNPTPDGVFFTTPEILPEAFPTNSKLVKK